MACLHTSIKMPSSNVDTLHEVNLGTAERTQRQWTGVRSDATLACANVATWKKDDVGLCGREKREKIDENGGRKWALF